MFVIDRARRDELRTAFDLAYRRLPRDARQFHVRRALDLVDAGAIDPQGVWIARRGRTIGGVQICVPLGGASFLFWLPQTRDREDLAAPLIQAALGDCRRQGGKVAQAIIAREDAAQAVPLV